MSAIQAGARFERVPVDSLCPGDLVHCYKHDDQNESRTARVESISISGPGVYVWPLLPGQAVPHSCQYKYIATLTCRHINLKHPDATGSEPFEWRLFNWNTIHRLAKE